MTTKPQWLMIGAQHPEGVLLLASLELKEVELREELDRDDLRWERPPFARNVSSRYFISSEMKTYVMILAPDYPTAFHHLFEQWDPSQAGNYPALATAPPALECDMTDWLGDPRGDKP